MWISSASQLQPSGLLRAHVGRGKQHRGPVSWEDQGQRHVQRRRVPQSYVNEKLTHIKEVPMLQTLKSQNRLCNSPKGLYPSRPHLKTFSLRPCHCPYQALSWVYCDQSLKLSLADTLCRPNVGLTYSFSNQLWEVGLPNSTIRPICHD